MLRFSSRSVVCISAGSCCIDWLEVILFRLSSVVCTCIVFSLCAGTGRLLQQRINRQVINLIQRIHQTLLDLCQSTADGRDNRIAVKLLYFPARGG